MNAYEMTELGNFRREQAALDKLPLAERKENAAALLADMRDNPNLIAERVGWLINGSYGQGSYLAARQVLAMRANANKPAALTIMVAGAEWRVPNALVRAAWHKLTDQQQKRLTAVVLDEIDFALAEMEREREYQTTRTNPARNIDAVFYSAKPFLFEDEVRRSKSASRPLPEPHGLVRAGNSIEWYRCSCGKQSNLLWTYKTNKSRILACSLDCALKKAKGQVKLGYLVDA